ncbi:hypothetical protein AQJ66_32400 [Streptomyces bungoensis]|uniref:Uncharacterized protein n=1 Tax=Streptomyces bungoensis TaxID=285568 RepID=A0A101SQ49_9ACTN|nr:DUF6008 family protein [Streptomyces bungoensis]KUN77918.1 hypothetical protein AQJ66_32400 [Streptomyces bungoensis]
MDHAHGAHGMGSMSGMGGSGVSSWDTLGALLLTGWAVAMWAAVVVLAFGNRRQVRPWMYKTAVAVIGLGVIGQVGHFQEHVAQVGYWVAHPYSPAWMTPWGTGLARGMGQVDPTKPTLGMEILHLVGNFIFLAGLVGIAQITQRAARNLKSRKWARMGVWMQTIHGLEHVVLTLSVALGATRAIGLSTWFGLIEPGPALVTYRVWWHFVANLIGTAILAIAVYHLWKERRAVKAAYEAAVPAASETAEAVAPATSELDASEESPVRETTLAGRP